MTFHFSSRVAQKVKITASYVCPTRDDIKQKSHTHRHCNSSARSPGACIQDQPELYHALIVSLRISEGKATLTSSSPVSGIMPECVDILKGSVRSCRRSLMFFDSERSSVTPCPPTASYLFGFLLYFAHFLLSVCL